MVLRSYFLGGNPRCGILLFLVYALVSYQSDESGFRIFHSQGFLVRRTVVQLVCRPGCRPFSGGSDSNLRSRSGYVRLCVCMCSVFVSLVRTRYTCVCKMSRCG